VALLSNYGVPDPGLGLISALPAGHFWGISGQNLLRSNAMLPMKTGLPGILRSSSGRATRQMDSDLRRDSAAFQVWEPLDAGKLQPPVGAV
jgi:hypothetical protein